MDAQVFIKEASITTAQIDDLSVTTAKIVDGNIINAKIGDTIQSNVFAVTATAAAGWRLSKSSGIEATAITIRDLNGNTILNSGGTVWDYVTGTSKPADGAEVNALGAQIKINYQSFTAANNGEIYVHGFNAAGVAADVNGYMFGIGTSAISHKETLVKGAIWTSGKTGWIMYAMSGIGFNHGGSFNKGAIVKKEGEQWYYDNNSSWATFTPNDWCWIIGSVVGSGTDAGGIVDGALISTPIHATRVNGFSELDKITSGNASTYIANLAVDTLQIADQAVTVQTAGIQSGTVTCNYAWQDITTVTFNPEGGGYVIQFSSQCNLLDDSRVTLQMLIGSTVVKTWVTGMRADSGVSVEGEMSSVMNYAVSSSSGAITAKVQVKKLTSGGMTVTNGVITADGAKK